jgi:hypothetical protein
MIHVLKLPSGVSFRVVMAVLPFTPGYSENVFCEYLVSAHPRWSNGTQRLASPFMRGRGNSLMPEAAAPGVWTGKAQ